MEVRSSSSILEYRVRQAHFFLEEMARAEANRFAFQCFAEAFASACRGITFAMQAVVKEVDGFVEFWAARQRALEADPLARFFSAYRAAAAHAGDTVVPAGAAGGLPEGDVRMRYFFMPIPEVHGVPAEDVFTACTVHFTDLLGLAFDLFERFKHQLDDRWYFTEANFRRMDKGLDHALEELGFSRAGLDAGGLLPEPEAWRTLRRTQTVGCRLNRLFLTYLGKAIAGPDEAAGDLA